MKRHKDDVDGLMSLETATTRLANARTEDSPIYEERGLRIPQMSPTETTLQLGPITFIVETRTGAMAQLVSRRFSRYAGDPSKSTVRLICGTRPAPLLERSEWDAQTCIHRMANYYILRSSDFEATYFPRHHMAWAAIPVSAGHISGLLQMLFLLWMQERDGFLLRGTTSVYKGKSYLFLDLLSAGLGNRVNTSHGGPWRRDEFTALIPLPDGGYAASSVPITEDCTDQHEPSEPHPLAGIYFVERGPTEQVLRLNLQEALPAFMHSVLCFAPDENSLKKINGHVERLLRSVSHCQLTLLNEDRSWEQPHTLDPHSSPREMRSQMFEGAYDD